MMLIHCLWIHAYKIYIVQLTWLTTIGTRTCTCCGTFMHLKCYRYMDLLVKFLHILFETDARRNYYASRSEIWKRDINDISALWYVYLICIISHILLLQIIMPSSMCEGGSTTKLFRIITDSRYSSSITTVQRKYFSESKGKHLDT